MKLLFAPIFLLLNCLSSAAQLIPYNKAGSWGVVTEKREPVIPFQYKSIEMRGDFILARNEASSDVYNRQGQKIAAIPGEYVYPALLKGKQAAIMPLKDGVEVRYLNGGVAVPAGTYDYIRAVQGGFEIMKNGKYGMVDQHLQEVLPPVYKEIQNIYGWVAAFNGNTTSTLVSARTLKPVTCKPTVHRMSFWENGFFVTDQLGLKGLMDTVCNQIIPNRYKYIYVGPHIIHAQKLNDQHDLYKKDGKKLVKEEVLEYHSNPHYYFISVKGKTYFYSKSLRKLREAKYDEIKDAEVPGFFKARKGNKWAVIDSTARLVYPLQEDGYYPIFPEYAAVGQYKNFHSEMYLDRGPVPAGVKGKEKLVYRNGEARSFEFSGRAMGLPVANRLAVVRGEKIGFVDFKGREVIPFVFDYDHHYETMHYGAVRTFSFDRKTGKALMFKDGKNVFIDTTGAILKDQMPELRSYHAPFGKGYRLVSVGEPFNQVGIVDADDKFVVPLTSESIQLLKGEVVVLSKNKKMAIFDLNLKQLTDYKYDVVHAPRLPGLLFVSRDGKTGYITAKGEEFFE